MPTKKMVFDDFEDPTPTNPLANYFRMPGIHIKLPSQGRYMKPGSVELTTTGEVPVQPMSASDEVRLKNPDALLSGFAIEKLIESCVPAVKDVKALSAPDVDALLLAIRAASYGNEMPVTTRCPKCGADNEYENMDLRPILDTVSEIDPEISVKLSPEVTVFLRPYNFGNATQASVAAFEEAKRLREVEKADDTVRATALNDATERLNRLNLLITADCVLAVATPQGTVTNHEHIRAFMENMPGRWFSRIENRLKEVNRQGVNRHQQVQCAQCQHEWDTEIEFDPSSFFALGS